MYSKYWLILRIKLQNRLYFETKNYFKKFDTIKQNFHLLHEYIKYKIYKMYKMYKIYT